MITQPDPSTVLPTGADPTNAMIASNPEFMSTIQSTLLNQSGMISSADTGLESAIRGAINKVAESTSKSSAAITSKYDREIGYLDTSQQNAITAARERGVGVNTSDIAYKALSAEADKNLKDLAQRRDELVLQNDAAGASKIAELMLKTSEMKIDAMQRTFQNLLAMGNFGLQSQQEKRAQKAQDFTERTAQANIALQYGIPTIPGETMEQTVTRAAKVAGPQKAAELAKTLAETNRIKAETNKLHRDGATAAFYADPANLDILAKAFLTDKTGLFKTNLSKEVGSFAKVSKRASDMQISSAKDAIVSYKTQGLTKEEAAAQFAIDFPMNDREDSPTMAALIEGYVQPPQQTRKRTLFGDVNAINQGVANFGSDFVGYFTGN